MYIALRITSEIKTRVRKRLNLIQSDAPIEFDFGKQGDFVI